MRRLAGTDASANRWLMHVETHPEQFDRAMVELGLLTIMTLIIVVSIILLRRFELKPRS